MTWSVYVQLAQYAHIMGKYHHSPKGRHVNSNMLLLLSWYTHVSVFDVDTLFFQGKTNISRGITVIMNERASTDLRVNMSGIYFIYAQLSHTAEVIKNGLTYGLFLDEDNIAKSMTTANHSESKFIGLLKSVEKGQTISLKTLSRTHVHFRDSFFGAFCVSRT